MDDEKKYTTDHFEGNVRKEFGAYHLEFGMSFDFGMNQSSVHEKIALETSSKEEMETYVSELSQLVELLKHGLTQID